MLRRNLATVEDWPSLMMSSRSDINHGLCLSSQSQSGMTGRVPRKGMLIFDQHRNYTLSKSLDQ